MVPPARRGGFPYGHDLSGQYPERQFPAATFVERYNPGDLAGSSVSLMGVVNAGQPNEILIGAPGFNASSGTAYLIPGRGNLSGNFLTGRRGGSPTFGVQFILNFTNSSSFSPQPVWIVRFRPPTDDRVHC